MKKKLLIFAVFVAAALFIASPCMADGCDPCDPCETVLNIGDVCVNADQYQDHQFEHLCLDNSTTMYGSGPQSIVACGLGDAVTFVQVEAELLQFEPYEHTEALPLGQISYEGTSQMHIYGMAGTDETCHGLSVNIQNDRNFSMENSMDESMMNSTASACAMLYRDITAAPGTIDSAGLNDQLHSYTFERNDGAWQQGLVRTHIVSGEFPQ